MEFQVAEKKFDPDLVVYNAGTDILDGDPLGRLKISLMALLVGTKSFQVCSREASPCHAHIRLHLSPILYIAPGHLLILVDMPYVTSN
ncbi:hypothetical protein HAX54_047234 [Datura stramonium]|uniref:Uncharacterized protein n=1 Tax=Datura stramonium TaxID=4076 RepID=A0ABS8SSU1_DATST|nr:hypothetical protein [Datura stramonium]